jgi:predicted nucleic acid-binding protein
MKLVVHTDVLLDHLCAVNHPSALRRAMRAFFCYTTVFHALEIFASLRSERERKAAEDMFGAMKILGLNAKNAPRYGRLFSAHPRLRPMDLLVAGLCLESRLPILSDQAEDFRGVRGLKVIPTRTLLRAAAASGVVTALEG